MEFYYPKSKIFTLCGPLRLLCDSAVMYNHTEFKTIAESVKTRRKPLAGNDVFLQMAGSTRWRDGFGLTAINHSPVAWREVEGVSRKTRPNIGSQSFWPAGAQRWRRGTRRKAEGKKANPDIGKDRKAKKGENSRKEEDTIWRRGNGVVRRNRPHIAGLCNRLRRKSLVSNKVILQTGKKDYNELSAF